MVILCIYLSLQVSGVWFVCEFNSWMVLKVVIGFQFIHHFVVAVLVRIGMFPSSLCFGPETNIGVNDKMK